MPDQPNSNGAAETPEPAEERPRSLRETIEAAYDEVVGDGDEKPAAPAAVDESGPPRDAQGRFTTKPGEAAAETPPSPGDDSAKSAPRSEGEPHPAPQGRSSEAPQNWSAEVRERFQKLNPEDQSFLLERHHAMESEFQRRVQATAQAASFVQEVAPAFSDPVIAGSLQQNGLSPSQAILELLTMQKRFLQDPRGLILDLAQRAQIDPAALAPSPRKPQGISDADWQDPAIQYFADHTTQTSQRVQALENGLNRMAQMLQQSAADEQMRATRAMIDAFAEEKDQAGNLLRPDFNDHIDQIVELYQANPGRNLAHAYETARWMKAETRQKMIEQAQQGAVQKISDQRARQAVRSNVRGITSPVSKPQSDNSGKSLREVIEESAREVGFLNS